MVASKEQVDLLFDYLREEGGNLFYVKTPVEFGVLGKPDE